MRRVRTLLGVLPLFLCACSASSGISTCEVYRASPETAGGLRVWIVDGATVRRAIYPEFLFGGNGERYTFIPADEVWIDNAISVDEYGYTLAHELLERRLMATRGLTYDDAHDSALALEQALRRRDAQSAREHEQSLLRVAPVDCDGLKEIAALPDSITLREIYRARCGDSDGVQVWIVDGAAVRRDIFPDFGFSGNDLAYRFIPSHEIWLDNAMTCEEFSYAVACELTERRAMAAGASYDDAYERALRDVAVRRADARRAAAEHAPVHVAPPLDRERSAAPSP